MRRGDVVWVDLDPTQGSEASRRRPAVVVSNDGANLTAARLGRGVLTVVPVTTNTDRVLPIRSVAVERIGAVAGRLTAELEGDLDDAIRLHLAV